MAKISGIHTPSIIKNSIINGNFDFWQRGTSFNSSGSSVYTADRWYQFSVSGATTSRQTAQTTGSQYAIKVQRNAGQTFTTTIALCQPFETSNIIPLRGKKLTLSFMIKAGANFSASGSILNYGIQVGTGSEGKFVGGSFTSSSSILVGTQAITSTLTRYSFTTSVVVPANATQMEVFFYYTPVGTAGADDSFTIEQVMLNEGVLPATFSRAGLSYTDELSFCQRYFSKSHPIETAPGVAGGNGGCKFYPNSASSTLADGVVLWPVPMRSSPTVTIYNGSSGTINQVRNTNATTYTVSGTDKNAAALVRISATGAMTLGASIEFDFTADSEL